MVFCRTQQQLASGTAKLIISLHLREKVPSEVLFQFPRSGKHKPLCVHGTCFRRGSCKSGGREKAVVTIQTSVKASTHSLEVGGLICHYHGSQPGSKHIHCQPAAQKCRHGVEQRPKDSSNDDRSRAVCCNISGAFAAPLACPMLLCSSILWLSFHTFPIRAVTLCPGGAKTQWHQHHSRQGITALTSAAGLRQALPPGFASSVFCYLLTNYYTFVHNQSPFSTRNLTFILQGRETNHFKGGTY